MPLDITNPYIGHCPDPLWPIFGGPVGQIASRQKAFSTMPPMGLIMPKEDSRDIIEYLFSLKQPFNKDKEPGKPTVKDH